MRRTDRITVGLVGLAGLVQALYLLLAPAAGFPLDDAWIHQTFARGLAQGAGMAYVSGPAVSGSTAPGWTFLLVPGFVLGIPRLWAFGLAWLGAALTAVEARRLAAALGAGRWGILAGGLGLLEWHLAWANASGMETGLFAAGTLALLAESLAGRRPIGLGLLGGALIWLRPEAIALTPLAAALWLRRPASPRDLLGQLLPWLPGLALGTLSWIGFNEVVAGRPLPATFYAKRAFYAHPDYIAFVRGGVELLLLSPVVLLLPAARGLTARGGRMLLWPIALWALYAAVLPQTYQHGRYLMPALPALGAILVAGLAGAPWSIAIRRLYAAAVVAAAVIGIGYGAWVYTMDVRTINDVQVAIARALAGWAGPGDEIASHDIGALGYFSGHRPVDLAGLVDPDIVPLFGDPPALAAALRARHVRYVVAFEGAYTATIAALGADEIGRVQPAYLQGTVWPPMIVYQVPPRPG